LSFQHPQATGGQPKTTDPYCAVGRWGKHEQDLDDSDSRSHRGGVCRRRRMEAMFRGTRNGRGPFDNYGGTVMNFAQMLMATVKPLYTEEEHPKKHSKPPHRRSKEHD
jgi:hypothetical protein